MPKSLTKKGVVPMVHRAGHQKDQITSSPLTCRRKTEVNTYQLDIGTICRNHIYNCDNILMFSEDLFIAIINS